MKKLPFAMARQGLGRGSAAGSAAAAAAGAAFAQSANPAGPSAAAAAAPGTGAATPSLGGGGGGGGGSAQALRGGVGLGVPAASQQVLDRVLARLQQRTEHSQLLQQQAAYTPRATRGAVATPKTARPRSATASYTAMMSERRQAASAARAGPAGRGGRDAEDERVVELRSKLAQEKKKVNRLQDKISGREQETRTLKHKISALKSQKRLAASTPLKEITPTQTSKWHRWETEAKRGDMKVRGIVRSYKVLEQKFQKAAEEMGKLEEESEAKDQRIEELAASLAETAGKLNLAEARAADLQKKFSEARGRGDGLRKELTAETAARRELEASLTASTALCAKHEEDLAELKAKFEALTAQKLKMDTVAMRAQEKAALIASKLEEETRTKEQREDEVHGLDQRMKVIRKKNAQLERALAREQGEKEHALKEVSIKEEECRLMASIIQQQQEEAKQFSTLMQRKYRNLKLPTATPGTTRRMLEQRFARQMAGQPPEETFAFPNLGPETVQISQIDLMEALDDEGLGGIEADLKEETVLMQSEELGNALTAAAAPGLSRQDSLEGL